MICVINELGHSLRSLALYYLSSTHSPVLPVGVDASSPVGAGGGGAVVGAEASYHAADDPLDAPHFAIQGTVQ